LEEPVDFSSQKTFPGTSGTPFDVLLHNIVQLQKLPALIFAGLLFVLAFFAAWTDVAHTLALYSFMLIDWLLLALLPKAGKSFGPARPPVLALAFARAVFFLLPFPSPANLIIQGIGTILVFYAFWIEPHHINVTRQQLTTQKLRPDEKVRVLHLADLHIERVTSRERELNLLIKVLQPDIIVFSGDFINLSYLHDPLAWEALLLVVKEWNAPSGVYVVTGSPAVDLADMIPDLIRKMPVRWLQDEIVPVTVRESQIDILGITCTHKPFIDGPTLKQVIGPNPKNFTLLVYHTPDLAPEAAAAGVDLQVSGHTHGGQVRLPFIGALFAGSLYGKRFEAGRYKIEDMTLYTSRGIGLEGQGAPRVRFLCPPEIILWEIEGQ
jgi:uncharacterized protein